MHRWETRMRLKHYLDQGVSKAELSRQFGVSRRTIHRWIRSGQLDRDLSSGASGYSPRPPVSHKLDPYKSIIWDRLTQYPQLSAKRLFDEVCAAGYPGSYSRVRDYVRTVRPRSPTEAVVRFETPAGRQARWSGRSATCARVIFYGRTFVSDADLNDQALRWLADTANVRQHGTTGERPVDRFEREERAALRPLAAQPYRRLGERRNAPPARRVLRQVPVQRRSLEVYAQVVR